MWERNLRSSFASFQRHEGVHLSYLGVARTAKGERPHMAIVRGVSAYCLGLSPAHMRFSAAQHSRRVSWQIWLSSTRSQGQSLVLTLRCPPESAPDFGSLGAFSRLLGLALRCCCFSPAHQDVMLLSESTAAPP